MADEYVFQDGDSWYFWDETGTQFLGPFADEYAAIDGRIDYERYLTSGMYPESLQQLMWNDAEEF